jgi:hypothetical protein
MSIITVLDDYEALRLANDCPYGLGASIFTGDESIACALAKRLHVGVVTINDLIVPTANSALPFGGCKRSGFGVTRGAEGLLEMTRPKVTTITRSRFRPAFEPEHPRNEELLAAFVSFAHGRGVRTRLSALRSLMQSLFNREKK